jgi:hypothetical protein
MSADGVDAMTPRKVDSLKKLADTNFAKFAVQVQHLSAEVQAKVIEQLPEFRKLAGEAIDKISTAHVTTLAASQESEARVHDAAEEWRSTLRAMLDDPNLSLDEKLRITAEIGETVKAQAAVHAENNKHRAALFGKVVVGVVAVAGLIVVAVTGGKFGVDQGGSDT